MLRKLLFCYRITADLTSFTKLLVNSKKLRYSKNNPDRHLLQDNPVSYTMRIGNKKRIVWMRTYAGDIDMFYEIFFKEIYREAITNTDNTIIDLGANVGMASLFFLHKNNTANIICVEPDTDNYKMLELNFKEEINSKQLAIIHAAIMPEEGKVFIENKSFKYNSSVNINAAEPNTDAVSMESILTKYNIQNIDLLKTDIEGSEKYLFAKNTNWLSNTSKIMIELHSNEDRNVVTKALDEYGFAYKPITADESNENLLLAVKE